MNWTLFYTSDIIGLALTGRPTLGKATTKSKVIFIVVVPLGPKNIE